MKNERKRKAAQRTRLKEGKAFRARAFSSIRFTIFWIAQSIFTRFQYERMRVDGIFSRYIAKSAHREIENAKHDEIKTRKKRHGSQRNDDYCETTREKKKQRYRREDEKALCKQQKNKAEKYESEMDESAT